MIKLRLFLCFLIASLAICGCSGKHPANVIQDDTLLPGYVLSKEGLPEHELITFRKKGVIWQSYKKVIVEPIKVSFDANSGLRRVAHAEKAQLQEMLEFRVRESLKLMFKLAKAPGADTLRLELNITDAPTPEALISRLPSTHSNAAALDALLSGTAAFRGKSGISGRITDATTGDLLMAVADQTEDDKILEEFMILWGSVGKHYRYWSWQLGYELCRQQHHKFCQKP